MEEENSFTFDRCVVHRNDRNSREGTALLFNRTLEHNALLTCNKLKSEHQRGLESHSSQYEPKPSYELISTQNPQHGTVAPGTKMEGDWYPFRPQTAVISLVEHTFYCYGGPLLFLKPTLVLKTTEDTNIGPKTTSANLLRKNDSSCQRQGPSFSTYFGKAVQAKHP